MLTDRSFKAYECDHMRPVVRTSEGWCHILPDGVVAMIPCKAGVYEVEATYSGDHPVIKLVRDL